MKHFKGFDLAGLSLPSDFVQDPVNLRVQLGGLTLRMTRLSLVVKILS